MVGTEWVVHTSLFQAVTAYDFDAQSFLIEVLNHHVLAMDGETDQIHQHYAHWLARHRWLYEWFRRMVSKAGGIVIYPLCPLDEEVRVELAGLGLTDDERPFVNTARQTLDKCLASDRASFPPGMHEYLREHLDVRVVTDWRDAVQRGQPLTEARVRWLMTQGEGESIEFKESLGRGLLKRAIETLAAFAAGDGGCVLFGVRDDGTVCGVQIGRNTLEQLAWKIPDKTNPPLTAPYLRIQEFRLDEGTVVAVSVDSIPARECRAYDRVCRRVGRRTQRE
jgi:hypothetical protein